MIEENLVSSKKKFVVCIGKDALSLSKEFSGKYGSKLARRSLTNAQADV